MDDDTRRLTPSQVGASTSAADGDSGADLTTDEDPGRGPRGAVHPVDVGHLVVGLVFLGMAGAWALRAADVIDTGELGWLLPLTLVLAGVVGLAASAAKGISRGRQAPDERHDVDAAL